MKYFRGLSYLFSLILFGLTIWLFFNRQNVLDWWRLRGYEPSPAIARLSSDASFSDEGRKLFYVHDPELLDKQDFQGKCSSDEETIVLGCYITHSKIYVFDVEDDRLEGVEEVTAAHEMLHAAFDRLSDDERERIEGLLLAVFRETDSQRLKDNIESYRTRDPSVVPNELHSILATEVRDLPQELEDHYSKYFLNRLDVVDKAESYEEAFTEIQDQISDYDKQLAELKLEIDQSQANIDQLAAALNTELNQLNALKSKPAQYNAAIPSYNQQVRNYNLEIRSLKLLIDRYNDIVEKRNELAVEEQELFESIDTRAEEI